MSRVIQLIAVSALLAGLTACGKDDATTTRSSTPATTANTTETATVADKTIAAKPEVPKDVTYRPLNARLRDNGERIVIMVPDDADIESGRMLEYRQAEDGTYYLKSVIPQ